MDITGVTGHINRVLLQRRINYTGWDFTIWLLISMVSALTGFSYKKMYGHFGRTKKSL